MIHSQHTRLLHEVARSYERESKNPNSNTFSLIVKSVAIGCVICLANSVLRNHLNGFFRQGPGRSH